MEEKIEVIKRWLGTGSINIFGLPMSGKDTQGIRLAEALNARMLSSGLIIRAMETETRKKYSHKGELIPSNVFYDWVLPYLKREDLANVPLILSSFGRWSGEEDQVLTATAESGHPIKAAIILNISEADVEDRYVASKTLNDRGVRDDDKTIEIFRTRLLEFRKQTVPVLQHYKDMKLLVEVNADQSREAVFNEIVEKLYAKASKSPA